MYFNLEIIGVGQTKIKRTFSYFNLLCPQNLTLKTQLIDFIYLLFKERSQQEQLIVVYTLKTLLSFTISTTKVSFFVFFPFIQ